MIATSALSGRWALVGLIVLVLGCGKSEPAYPEAPPPAVAIETKALPKGTLRRADVVAVVDQGLGHFLARVQLEPSLEQGKFAGFRLLSLQPPTFWEGIDLRSGDVVERINGQSIEQPDQAFAVFESLRKAKSLRVSFVRAGKPKQLVFPISG